MTIIEASAVVTAAALTAMAITGAVSHLTKILLMKKAEAEFEKLKTGLNLGTQIGAVIGGLIGSGFEAWENKMHEHHPPKAQEKKPEPGKGWTWLDLFGPKKGSGEGKTTSTSPEKK